MTGSPTYEFWEVRKIIPLLDEGELKIMVELLQEEKELYPDYMFKEMASLADKQWMSIKNRRI